jgi:hypothetical protein
LSVEPLPAISIHFDAGTFPAGRWKSVTARLSRFVDSDPWIAAALPLNDLRLKTPGFRVGPPSYGVAFFEAVFTVSGRPPSDRHQAIVTPRIAP